MGSSAKRRVDLRVVSAVQDGFSGDVESGAFRRDLFQRVAGVVIELPPLAARLEDVVPLAEHFAALSGHRLEPGVEQVLLRYAWPGNARELRFVLERAGELVDNGTLPPSAVLEAIELGLPMHAAALQRVDDRTRFVGICETHGWEAARICAALGIGRTTLHRRLHELGLSLRRAKKYGLSDRSVESG